MTMQDDTSRIDFLSLRRMTAMHDDELRAAVQRVVDSGWYLQGEENAAFEREYAEYVGTRYCVGCANGLDALTLIVRAYKELGRLHDGDEVLVPANTFIASVLAISENGLKPVLVEPDAATLEMDGDDLERRLTDRSRAVLLVHLYGRCAMTERIAALCREHHLLLIEDNAQAHGCRYGDRRTGSLGDAAGHSFYPGKNLGAMGDGGAVTTDNEELAVMVRTLANYGSQKKYVFEHCGRNSRLDEVQAAVLRVKLRHLDEDNATRRRVAEAYGRGISHPEVAVGRGIGAADAPAADHVYHLFPVFCHRRDDLQRHLAACGIGTQVHYPIPPHRQQCYAHDDAFRRLSLPVAERLANTELSLPMAPYLTDEETARVIEAVNGFE